MTNVKTLIVAAALAMTFNSARADISGYYIGYDDLPGVFAPAIYRGLPNPNRGHITLFFPHPSAENRLANHFHNLGSFSYSGPTNDLTIVPTNSNARIPEVATRQAPLTLVPGKGVWAGKLVSATTPENYSTMRFRSVQSLRYERTATATNEFGYGSPEWHMLFNRFPNFGNFDNAVYSKPIPASTLAFELVWLSPGLHIGLGNQMDVVTNPGDRVVLGDANDFDFQPVFWAEASAATGPYTAAFRFVDISGGEGTVRVPESGISFFDFRVVGAPSVSIERTVRVQAPAVTVGYVLESAPTPDGPWTAVTQAMNVDSVGAGEGAAQTGSASLVLPADEPGQFFRLRKLEGN
ncbi:MAG: hypothetical protein JNN07_24735 [Verrucomicrobiales bacterium]|nr:hypothetical protein [Verrucomicrobiales bacterium]